MFVIYVRRITQTQKIKYKYKAKRKWRSWYEEGWERIELCQECLDKIIEAKNGVSDEE